MLKITAIAVNIELLISILEGSNSEVSWKRWQFASQWFLNVKLVCMAVGYQVLVPACFKQVPVFTPNSPRWYQCPTGYTGVFIDSYALMPEAQQFLDPMGQPFDYVFAGSVWGLAFTTVVGLYLVARSAGTVLNFIRRG